MEKREEKMKTLRRRDHEELPQISRSKSWNSYLRMWIEVSKVDMGFVILVLICLLISTLWITHRRSLWFGIFPWVSSHLFTACFRRWLHFVRGLFDVVGLKCPGRGSRLGSGSFDGRPEPNISSFRNSELPELSDNGISVRTSQTFLPARSMSDTFGGKTSALLSFRL